MYTDTVEVEAETPEKAQELALEQMQEVYECIDGILIELLED